MIKYKPKPRLKNFEYCGNYRYFVTICTDRKSKFFENNNHLIEKMIEYLHHAAEKHLFTMWVYCFMPDHLHFLAEGMNEQSDLKKFIKEYKQRTGYWFKHKAAGIENKLWQPGYYEHILRKAEDTNAVSGYILDNPVRKGLVKHYLDYPYLGSTMMDIRDIYFIEND